VRSVEFYQMHLDRVSRSFAFCIRKLEDPLRRHVSLSYLLCRVLDTIEDSAWTDADSQTKHYQTFEKFIQSRPSLAEVNIWQSDFPTSIPESEKVLLQDAFSLFEDLHDLPKPVFQILHDTVLRMYQGMRHYSDTQVFGEHARNELKLFSLKDVNQYCYFVAGVVGELLTKLFLVYRPDFTPSEDLLKDSFHFGLFLQKINLLKDQLGDEKEGRYLVPNRELLFYSLRENAQGSLRYLTSLPESEAGFRTFCAWSLFLGLGSVPFIQNNFAQGGGVKISREATEVLLEEIESIVGDNEAILNQGRECLALLPESPPPHAVGFTSRSANDEWFHQISGNVLGRDELRELGIIAS
jgi:farnesyl-diphosphate farnesyltransferase